MYSIMTLMNRILDTDDNSGTLILHLFLGLVFVAHGEQNYSVGLMDMV